MKATLAFNRLRSSTTGFIYWWKNSCKDGKRLWEDKNFGEIFFKVFAKESELTWMLREEEWYSAKNIPGNNTSNFRVTANYF